MRAHDCESRGESSEAYAQHKRILLGMREKREGKREEERGREREREEDGISSSPYACTRSRGREGRRRGRSGCIHDNMKIIYENI